MVAMYTSKVVSGSGSGSGTRRCSIHKGGDYDERSFEHSFRQQKWDSAVHLEHERESSSHVTA